MKQSKITFLTSLGAGLEYYDYVIYILLANFIGKQFFPSSSHAATLFAAFGVLAMSNIVRPFGGIIFGVLGDRFGRRNIVANTLLLMAFATFLMGITPTFATIGLTATIIFSLCRIVQSVTCGAEMPGAMTFLSEHIKTKRHGIHFGFMSSAVGLGSTSGAFVIWLLTKNLTEGQILSWGFRLPFLLGGILAVIGFLIRKKIPETKAFLAVKKSSTKLSSIFCKEHIGQVFIAIGVVVFPACFITLFLTLPVYLNEVYHYALPDIYLILTIGSLWTAVVLPIFGWVSDYIGRKFLFFLVVALFIVFSFPLFLLLQLQNFWALFCFIILGKTIIAAMAASYFALLPQAFPTVVRCTGTACSYNIAYTIAALIPLITNYIYQVLKEPNYLIGLLAILALISAISIVALKDISRPSKILQNAEEQEAIVDSGV